MSGGSTVTSDVTGLTSSVEYTFRVIATKTGELDGPPSDTVKLTPGKDYDADGDGMLEITTLAQLNAIRYDLDGDGAVDDLTDGTATSTYADAFSGGVANLGCPNTGCTGYELRANLDFNTQQQHGDVRQPNGRGQRRYVLERRRGGLPIGGVSGGAYTGDFDGNADTDSSGDGGPYTISNLFINSTTGGNHWGLFGRFDSSSNQTVEDVGLVNVDITVSTTTSNSFVEVVVGGLAGTMFSLSASKTATPPAGYGPASRPRTPSPSLAAAALTWAAWWAGL